MSYDIGMTKPNTTNIRSNPPKNLSVPEAAEYIGISERYLRNLITGRKIPCCRIDEKTRSRIVFRLCDIDRWLESKLIA
jgi:excisionase family DNA binding protein